MTKFIVVKESKVCDKCKNMYVVRVREYDDATGLVSDRVVAGGCDCGKKSLRDYDEALEELDKEGTK